MMKTSRRVIIIFLLTLIALSCESAFQELNSTNDLKRIYSDESVPMHSLTLLHWFANNVDIDNNNAVYLLFDTNRDFGSHSYKNCEGLLPSAPKGYQYSSVGNVNRPPGDTCPNNQDFPEYVLYPRVIEPPNTGRNRDRIIVSVPRQNNVARTVNQMYLTQHFLREDNQGSRYDPNHTFRITPNLLQQLRQFSFNDDSRSLQKIRNQFDQNINNSQLNDIINSWGGDQAPLGLLYFIVVPQRNNLFGVCRGNRRWARDLTPTTTTGDRQNCEIQHMHVQVMTGGNGKAKILWRNVPRNLLNGGVAVALFKNHMDQGKSREFEKIQDSEGSYDTAVPLSEGLQVRLHKIQSYTIFQTTLKEEICRGKEFKNPQAVPVTGYAQLELFARYGKACFRLYIKQDCDQWKTDFYNSWVGLYTSEGKDTDDYLKNQWQWATKFTQSLDSGEDHTFEYCTSTTVTPGLQARFVIERRTFIAVYNEENARTPAWHWPSH